MEVIKQIKQIGQWNFPEYVVEGPNRLWNRWERQSEANMVEVGGQILRHLGHLISNIHYPLVHMMNLFSQVLPLRIGGQQWRRYRRGRSDSVISRSRSWRGPARAERRWPGVRMSPGSVNQRVSSTRFITPIFNRQSSSRNFMSKAKWRLWFWRLRTPNWIARRVIYDLSIKGLFFLAKTTLNWDANQHPKFTLILFFIHQIKKNSGRKSIPELSLQPE